MLIRIDTEDHIKSRFLLLDTCFLVELKKYAKTPFFNEMMVILNNSAGLTINEFIKFEFLKGARTIKHIQTKKDMKTGH